MKLYATTTSDKGGREAKKGGDRYIMTRYSNGNIPVFEVSFFGDDDKRGHLEIMRYDGYDNIITVPYRDDKTGRCTMHDVKNCIHCDN